MERRRMAVGIPLVAMGSLIVALVAVPARAGVPRCFGEKATVGGPSGDDVRRGTGDDDVIAGLGGDDIISGKGGEDLICAGKGNDTVRAGGGIDLTFGGAGDDEIFGNAGAFNDAVPGPGDDFVDGGPSGEDGVVYLDAPNGVEGDLGAGTVTGHGTDEVVNVEWLIGSSFDDVLTGTDIHDGLFGADGNDQLEGLGDAAF